MRYVLIAVGVLAALILAIVLVGMVLPTKHRAGREATYNRPAAEVFRVINTPADFPNWRTGVNKIDVLPAKDGKPTYREFGKDGTILFEVEQITPDSTLVTRIADKSLPFGGAWTYTLTPKADSTTLRIVEDGEVYNPVFRFVSRFVIGHTSTIDRFMRDLGKRLGQQEVVITDA
ncbi:MAG TPA: SRPBCC family protein [Gemmatimonadaceae bacterium]